MSVPNLILEPDDIEGAFTREEIIRARTAPAPAARPGNKHAHKHTRWGWMARHNCEGCHAAERAYDRARGR